MEVAAITALDERPAIEELVVRARGGEFSAFEDLYRRLAGRVYAVCLRLTADPGRAEEAAQDAFVNAWKGLGSYREDTNFVAWLRRVAVNAVLSERRARRRREFREQTVEDVGRLGGAAGGPAGGARVDLERAIAALPRGARDVFVLHDVEGYRHEDIARMLGVATGTSKAQLHRARKLLREALQ